MATKLKMNFADLMSKIDKVTTKKTYDKDDTHYWKLSRDKAGNGTATLRFLPNKDIEELPFVRMFSHSFKNEETGRWYIENSLSTIGGQDYIGTVNQELWNSGIDENKKIASKQKRKLQYISNVQIMADPANPENVGKVMLFKYGQKIFDMIRAAAEAKATEGMDEDDVPEAINAWDFDDGALFYLKCTQVAGFPNYDTSKFGKKKAVANGDEDGQNEVHEKCFDLSVEVAPDKFKTAAELEKQYKWVMGENAKQSSKASQAAQEEELDELADMVSKPTKTAPAASKAVEKKKVALPVFDDVPDEDDSAFFASLVD